jgi:NAD(P)-dependent dehydrogenase (short-subunit alcohol dehydrogenase family)
MVLVTRGNGGIRGAIAGAFLAHGAEVIVEDLVFPACESDAPAAREIFDVRDEAAVAALAARMARLDVLIHCTERLVRLEEHKIVVFTDFSMFTWAAINGSPMGFDSTSRQSKGAI